MFNDLHQQLVTALIGRLMLVLNHVLASEEVATQRLKPHAGRRIRLGLNGAPPLLPLPALIDFVVTPAGGLEWYTYDASANADLQVSLDASNPARALWQGLSGERPRVSVAGDAEFAADVSWLFDNLRWDLQDDLAQLIGPGPARELGRIAATLVSGLREAVRSLSSLADKARSTAGAGPAGPAPR